MVEDSMIAYQADVEQIKEWDRLYVAMQQAERDWLTRSRTDPAYHAAHLRYTAAVRAYRAAVCGEW
jgi:hypothetical protein